MSLLIRIDRYLRHTHMSRSQFGRLAVNDPRLVTDLMRGRMVKPETQARIERFLAERQA
jgi:hypothetical protein